MSTDVASSSRAAPNSRHAQRNASQEHLSREPEAIGASVVYLGGLNYFLAVNEKSPIVSRIGTVLGHLHVTIEPFIAPPCANGTRDSSRFERYEPPPIDKPEDQVFDFLDRTIEYRLTIDAISELTISTKKYSRLSLRYSFYRDPSRQCGPIPVTDTTTSSGSVVRINNCASHHIVDVTEPLVKYLTGSNLLIEVRFSLQALATTT